MQSTHNIDNKMELQTCTTELTEQKLCSETIPTIPIIPTLEELYKMIAIAHNSDLVDDSKSPNENIIYHIYNDGEITYQKGGWAYLQRSIFNIKYPLQKSIGADKFPIQDTDIYKNKVGHAIATKKDCLAIHEYMKLLM